MSYLNPLQERRRIKRADSIGLDAIIMAGYIASSPVHQSLVLANGGTITKYLAVAVMAVIVLLTFLRTGKAFFDGILLRCLGIMAFWFTCSLLWSRFGRLSSMGSILSYFLFMLIVCSKEWTVREKHLFKVAMIAACTFYAVTLIRSAGTMKRATFIFGTEEKEADQNVLADNLGLGLIFAVYYFLNSKNRLIRLWAVFSGLVIIGGIVATGSRGGLFAALAGILYYIFSYRKRDSQARQRIILFSVLLILAVFFLLNTNYLGNTNIVSRLTGANLTDTSNRIEIWGRYFELLIHRPWGLIVGYGYGQGMLENRDFSGFAVATHNDILFILTGTGLIGIILTIQLVRMVWKKSLKIDDHLGRACVVLMLIAGLSVDIFGRYGWWNSMLFAYIGIGAVGTHEINTETSL